MIFICPHKVKGRPSTTRLIHVVIYTFYYNAQNPRHPHLGHRGLTVTPPVGLRFFHPCDFTPLAVVSRARKSLRVSTTATIAQIPAASSKEGAVDRRCTQHAKIPSGSSLTSDTYE
jgi:hypothetical protein